MTPIPGQRALDESQQTRTEHIGAVTGALEHQIPTDQPTEETERGRLGEAGRATNPGQGARAIGERFEKVPRPVDDLNAGTHRFGRVQDSDRTWGAVRRHDRRLVRRSVEQSRQVGSDGGHQRHEPFELGCGET